MTLVSLSHIAGGVEHITRGAVPEWQAWGVAIVLDINYVAMEMARVVAAMAHVEDRLQAHPVRYPERDGFLDVPQRARIRGRCN
jgi:hypothetical protein